MKKRAGQVFPFYMLFFAQFLMCQVNSVFFYKKYQVSAGTSFGSNVIYLIINGVVSALVSVIIIVVQGSTLEATPYSLIMAAAIVLSSAIGMIARLKCYELGQIATVSIISTIGGIVISCAWGVLFWDESISGLGFAAILIMIVAAILMVKSDSVKVDKKLLWLYLFTVLSGVATSLLSKQHQMEKAYAAVDTLSFSVWIGVVRTVLFLLCIPFFLRRKEKKQLQITGKAVGFAAAASVVDGSAYVMQLIYAAVLPISVTSPLGTGLGIIASALLPWLFFREKIDRRQFLGVVLSVIGSLLYILT